MQGREIDKFNFERLDAYQRALEFIGKIDDLFEALLLIELRNLSEITY